MIEPNWRIALRKANSFVDILRNRADHQPNDRAFAYLPDGETEAGHVTFGQLDSRARSIAAWLVEQSAQGERILLMFPPGLDFISGFMGCLYAKAVAVPTIPPRRNRPSARLDQIIANAGATIALTTADILSYVQVSLAHTPSLGSLVWEAIDQLPAVGENVNLPEVSGDDLAFFQYSSGSTAEPKGVMVTHANLLHNSEVWNLAEPYAEGDVGCVWVPPYHDMGLIEGILQPLFAGYSCCVLPPAAFIQQPIRWLKTISKYRVTRSGGPNFAYDLCIQKVSDEECAALDLSSWRFAYNGAEPIRSRTVEGFKSKFRAAGFRPECFQTGYGLAESTLLVSLSIPHILQVKTDSLKSGRIVEANGDGSAIQPLVSSGHVLDKASELVIVDPETREICEPDEVGEIWLKGSSVASGYWNRDSESDDTFGGYIADTGKGPYLRTGDLGFMWDDRLYVTGRIKDLIIIGGQNYAPQDIELTAENCHPAIRRHCVVALSLDQDEQERLVLIGEVNRDYYRELDVEEVVETVREAVAAEFQIRVYELHLIRPGSMPKTTSGKLQRQLCKKLLLNGELSTVKSNRQHSNKI